ncbi:MAG: ornithine carbamoyltransferase [Alphaproteobacteria bacterium]|nr:ornithine carbamoyltransferase [Alphaproteobacteria bacterium]MDA7987851.1 ornithine carbamoyltransferase [Alphaproteobacteria bacterium]
MSETPAPPRHFLEIEDFSSAALERLLALAAERKSSPPSDKCRGRTLALFFHQPSTRTRLSFAAAIARLGGHGVVLLAEDLHLDRGESVADTARVISCYADAVLLRSTEQTFFDDFVSCSEVPVINGLTARSHPCQVLADMLTLGEVLDGALESAEVAWSGAFNNMTRSYLHAAMRLGFGLRVAAPPPIDESDGELLKRAQNVNPRIRFFEDAKDAVSGADAVVTDAWSSLGDSEDSAARAARHAALEPYRVDAALMARAAEDAVFLHCLPAHRGEEVTSEVIDGPRSRVWLEAANRLPAQEAILLWVLGVEDLPRGG